ncbi:hypothetical protein B0T14DRAFT_542672 [Immersiella caudata]|uniref:Uncharacterized protein n=1 Tax=Immersiella caudata TaxID=314043 RepID=A0AA40CCZ8_9PEZI|nr:hypothetical protein B0T14DRAFT_542672 [Immersiella caudata]
MFHDHRPGTRRGYPLDGNENTTTNASGKQPTYTTVGSIYNPNAAAPLQPPTRRPRTRRYPPNIQSPPGDPYLSFPNSLLSVLPMKDRVQVSPPPPVKPAPHYSPLQQNYDRAVSPTPEEDSTFLLEAGMPVPSIRSDSDSTVSQDAHLTNWLNTRGLTNLASYPNPAQSEAKITLARARTANVTVQRLSSPLPVYGAKERTMNINAAPAGTPQPLTAGPPGQRQFRPSTFESTVRALGGLDENPPPVMESEEQASVSDDPWTHTFSSGFYIDGIISSPPCPMSPTSYKAAERRIPYETEPLRNIIEYYPSGRPRDLGKKIKNPSDRDFDAYKKKPEETAAERRARINRDFSAGTEGLGKTMDQVVREHDNICLKNTIGVIGGERDRARAPKTSGAAGGNSMMQLPHLSVEQANITHDSLHAEPLLNMAFATLLRNKEEMNKASKFNTHGFTAGFIPCEPAWVDHSIEGNKSFFDTSREDDTFKRDELLRRRKMTKRPRAGRGY